MKITRYLALFTALCALLLTYPTLAEDGAPFFLLSDAAFGSNDIATVRLEMQDLASVPEYGGVDVYVYRVSQPMEFLKSQKNLHRINVKGDYVGEGFSNALARIWDSWWVNSRESWRKVFSLDARTAVTAQASGVRTHPLESVPTPLTLDPKYRPLQGHTLVDSFRYPIHQAQSIMPPKGLKMEGSSSEFMPAERGKNVMIPLGKRKPGLYLVEVMAGDHRAVTLVFVSNSIAVTKVSGKQMLVWVANRTNGSPVANAKTVWTDGVGVLGDGKTDKNGLVSFPRSAPEKTYLYGEDPQGGVYVAENFYYDSEIYNTKLYAVTDRPLYRAGETVFVKFMGRTFTSARDSTPITAGELKLQVFDANGFPVAGKTLKMTPQSGGDTSFQLPDNAVAGGYELRFAYKGNTYGAAFRVAEYQKPHFEIKVLPEKRDFKTNEPVKGKMQLFYPDGKPVVKAKVELTARSQRISMIEGDLGYAGQFPVQLTTESLVTDAKGVANFVLPPASDPSRYVLSALATDGASYRVRVTKEILVERGINTYALKSERAFSAVGEKVDFAIQVVATADAITSAPVAWEWVRLENRQRASGKLANSNQFSLNFAESGTYTVSLRDATGNLVGATSHYVSGAGLSAPQGSIDMVFDKRSYRAGETAHALVTFPQKVEQALFTLERDKVEKTALLTSGADWVHATRLTPTQWKVDMPVRADYGPNITLSVVYVQGGEYVFQNLGLKVEIPRIEVTVQADKAVYAPGEKVTLDLSALVGGKVAAGTQLTVGVVDEMIYVLQPEIAPDIADFFYHPRRNNVRTSASLSFIAYDLAKPPSSLTMPSRSQTPQRAIKVLERPRREDKDTAFWQPSVAVDKQGHAKVSFVMPDSLTRWRVTVRATAPAGTVGQGVSYLRSDKDFYVKWTSPNWMRSQDAPNASVAIFNQGNQAATAELSTSGGNLKRRDSVNLKPGANFVSLPLSAAANAMQLNLALAVNKKTVDALTVPLKVVPLAWQSPRSLSVPLTSKDNALKLPPDASNIRLQLTDSANAQLRRVMEDLITYPYGCVEQTASRLIPYSLALQSLLPTEAGLADQLAQRLHSYRFRLAQMAGDQATFGWWRAPDREENDPLLTTYAYYADWHASRALKLSLPNGHFERLLEVYRSSGAQRSPWHRALMLHWMQEIGLPVRSMAEALLQEQLAVRLNAPTAVPSAQNSLVLGTDERDSVQAMTLLLTGYVVQQSKGTLPPKAALALSLAAQQVEKLDLPLGDALLLLTGKLPVTDAGKVLEQVRAESPTIDRALTLIWTYRALGGGRDLRSPRIDLAAPWQAVETSSGQRVYRWNTGVPNSINLAAAPTAGLTAMVQFDSREAETSQLAVKVERHIYRMVQQSAAAQKTSGESELGMNYTLELLPSNAVLKTDELYLDEIMLVNTKGSPLRFGILEVPLPPGATADRSTWGINIQSQGKPASPLERAQYELTPQGYAVPVEVLHQEMVIRHLVRAAQTGKFTLPPVRYYPMYQPTQKAFEAHPRGQIEIR
ncbi:MAG: MG2 domain-containing protein [Gallionella sp.]|nr:MG2 domain-containing protein [Gallionella sp.]MDD4959292.1 MG2 domain-containing protein [Gallionella sp.]